MNIYIFILGFISLFIIFIFSISIIMFLRAKTEPEIIEPIIVGENQTHTNNPDFLTMCGYDNESGMIQICGGYEEAARSVYGEVKMR